MAIIERSCGRENDNAQGELDPDHTHKGGAIQIS